jgi:hypothetical protein
MKTTTLVAGVLAFAALSGSASAQSARQFHNFQNNGRVFTPPVNANTGQFGRFSGNVAPSTFSNFSTPFSNSSSFASPYNGYSSNFTPFGASSSGYAAQGFPRVLTPFGPVPTMYSTYSSSTSYGSGFGFGYPGYVPPSNYSSVTTPFGNSTSYSTPYGTLSSGYAAQDFPRVLTPFGNVPVNYNTFGSYSSPFGSGNGVGFVSPYGTAP